MSDDVTIAVRLRGALKAAGDAKKVAGGIREIGTASTGAAAAAKKMGGAVSTATASMQRGLGAVGGQARFAALGVFGLAAAGLKMGLTYNAQIENARLRFGLFTDDVDGLMNSVKTLDKQSATFGFGELADAAAMLGNSNVKDIPNVLQGAANAAAASGKGVAGLQSIVIALSQIQAKGRLSQEEINQLTEAGAPGAQAIIAKGFNLTAKQLQNLGGEGLDATKALQLLTNEWTSGKMAKAAERQSKSLGGQWSALTSNMRTLSGAATKGLASDLEHNLLPAANKAATEITKIFEDKGLSNEQKIKKAREVIRRVLGPVWEDIKHDIDKAHIPEKLGEVVGAALPKIASAAGQAAPAAAKAFVDAWLNSSEWARLLTALFIWNKLGKPGKGKGKGGGGLGGPAGAPIPVIVTNWPAAMGGPDGPGGPVVVPPGGGKPGKPSRRQRAGRRARQAGKAAGWYGLLNGGLDLLNGGDLGSAIDAADPTSLLNLVGLPSLSDVGSRYSGGQGWGHLGHDLKSLVPSVSVGRGDPMAGHDGIRPLTQRVTENINLHLDSQTVARTTRYYDAIEQGRLAATAAARR